MSATVDDLRASVGWYRKVGFRAQRALSEVYEAVTGRLFMPARFRDAVSDVQESARLHREVLEVVAKHGDALVHYTRDIVGNEEAAEDIERAKRVAVDLLKAHRKREDVERDQLRR